MDTRTGQIKQLTEEDAKLLKNDEDLIPIDMNDATDKQKKEMQVSIHDSVSTLGRLFTGCRAERRHKAKIFKGRMKRKHPVNETGLKPVSTKPDEETT